MTDPFLPILPAHANLDFPIRITELDVRGRLSIPALVVLIGEAADLAARTVGLGVHDLLEQDRAWVLRTLWMKMETTTAFPAAGEVLRIRTFPSRRSTPLRFYRDFFTERASGELLGRCSTEWIFLEASTRRPLRFRKKLQELAGSLRDPALGPHRDAEPALPEPGSFESASSAGAAERMHVVAHHDIDWNGHVNNAVFVRWVLDAAPSDFWASRDIGEFFIRFEAEARIGEVVMVDAAAERGNRCVHRLRRGDRALVTAVSLWT